MNVHDELNAKLTAAQVDKVLLKCLANLNREDETFQAVTWNCWDEPKEPAEDFYSFHCSRYVFSNFYATLSTLNTCEFALLRAVRQAEAEEEAEQIESYLLSM